MSSEIASPATGAGAQAGGTPPAGGAARPPLRHVVARWEYGLVVVLIGALLFGHSESATFTTKTTLFYGGINTGYIAIMALPMTLIVITAEIDLSVASTLGMAGALLGDLWHHGWPIWPALIVALAAGAAGGALNGVLVAKAGLPSIAVTIGTLTLFRGIAEILLGSQTVPGAGDRTFPEWLTKIGVVPVPGTELSYTTLIFIVLAIGCGVVLHATPLGRSLFATGLQPEAARFSGIRVARVKFWLFVFSGLICAFAGILLTAQNSSVSYDAGYGLELNVVAIVLFGGVSIFGGKGSVPGVVLSAAIVAALQMALTQMTVDPNVQEIVIGGLLLISVIVPSFGKLARWSATRVRRSRQLAAPSLAAAPHRQVQFATEKNEKVFEMKRFNIPRLVSLRRPAALALTAGLAVSLVAACSSSSSSSGSAASSGSSASSTGSSASSAGTTGLKKGLVVYFIPKDTQNPYEVLADKGGETALSELGGKVVVSSGTQDTAAAQIPSIQAAIQAHANAIVIAGNDPSALCPSLNQAAQQGIKILSFDSDVTCGSTPNHLFINQANAQSIGESEVAMLAKEIGGSGQIAILSAAASATNQNSWIAYMKQELKKYPNMKLDTIVYGNDDPATSLTVLQGLLSAYPNLKGIISPTTVGIQAAAQYFDTHKSLLKKITLTGLGLPSQMRPYVKDGTVKEFELWNPTNLGYLAGYAAAALASNAASYTAGSSFKAGHLGTFKVLAPAAGVGPSVVLGVPTVFNASNIDQFNF